MQKYEVLEMVWVPADLVATLEVAKLVPPLELLLVSWGYYDPEYLIRAHKKNK